MTERGLFDTSPDVSDEAQQAALAELDVDEGRLAVEDLERLMSEPWGRRVLYRVVFLVGRLNASSFEPRIKDGMAAALHMARNEGLREGAAVFAEEAQRFFPDLWDLMVAERQRARLDVEARRRGVIESTSSHTDGG